MTNPILRCGSFTLDLSRPCVMGVLNLTPDSFSDGGRYNAPDHAIRYARQMAEEGADIIDVGGESTRPGAPPVPEEEELRRVLPVVEALRELPLPISVDTRKPAVMRAVIAAGASMINDVNALSAPGAVDAVRTSSVAVCLMHMRGEPHSMQCDLEYTDVVDEVVEYLAERAQACRAAGIAADRIVLDPGFGFGKSVEHNLQLLRRQRELVALGYPVLAGLSRKSTIGALTGRDVDDRVAGSLAAALAAVDFGACIVRVHDVRETVDALRVWCATHNDLRAA